jgi:hypothetical protein
MQDIEGIKGVLQQGFGSLKGYAKRVFMAKTVREVFGGVPYRAHRELGWSRATLDKALHELDCGVECLDGRRGNSGRKLAEEHSPKLLEDIREICDSQSQTDARFRTNRLYTRMSAAEVRDQLKVQKGYAEEGLPCEDTIRRKLNQLGYHPVRVQKTQVKKRSRRQTPSSTP